MFAYLITQGRGIAERNVEEFRRVVGFSPAKSKSAIGRRRKQVCRGARHFTDGVRIVAATANTYSGLQYPIIIGLTFLPETKDREMARICLVKASMSTFPH